MKKFVSGLIFGVVISLSLSALAATLEMVEVSRNSINLEVNGEKISSDNFLYEGRTYVQMREIAEMLGKEVGWNGETRTASINEKLVPEETSTPIPTPTPTPTEVKQGYNRLNPANIGEKLNIKIDDYSNNYESDIKLIEVLRGQQAWSIIKETNQFNEEAGEGYEYILAKIQYSLIKHDKRLSLSTVDFTLVSENGKDYEHAGVVLEPSIDAYLYQAAEHEGYVAFKVKNTDLKPVITYGRSYDGTGGIWFKAYQK